MAVEELTHEDPVYPAVTPFVFYSEPGSIEWLAAVWETRGQFDLVLDSGCLHSLIAGSPQRYKERLVSWLAPGADYVLGHWGKRHALDWRPFGPRRRSRREIVELFAPELVEHAHEEALMTGVPLPFGPSVLGVSLWFKRSA